LLEGWTELVRLLRMEPLRMISIERHQTKIKRGDFRVICDCQIHAKRQRSMWRRSVRAVTQLKAKGIALLVGVPLALGALQFPTEAMNVSIGETLLATRILSSDAPANSSTFAIFTTPRIRAQFLEQSAPEQTFTLDLVKEQFFRTNVPYGSIIYREAVRNGLSPELVAAVIESESDFRPRLVSNKNALGLMQIVPETGRLMGADDLFNPSENIAAGTKYLRYLIDRFPDQRLALAAYNAGEGNVEKFGGIPPFSETQNYVRNVTTRNREYRDRVRGTYLASMRIKNSLAIR
jgi:soluble lytic murein transglycosylase-like protein